MEPLPGLQERLFHVEHSPVKETPPPGRALLEKLMDFGIDDLRREVRRQLGKALSVASGNTRLDSATAGLDTHHEPPSIIGQPPDNSKLGLTPLDQVLEAPGPK